MKYIAPHLSETLAFVPRKRWATTREICIHHRSLGAKPTQRAIANRLQKLRAEKLVVCRVNGRDKLWRRA